MPKIDVTVKNATKIPLLGVKTQPSPYIIIECQQISYTSSIAKYSQNPIWNYHTTIQAKKVTSYVYFYIYNNNPNAVDQLLAYGKIQFGQLMTRTNTQYKLRLMNSLQEPINSYLYIVHYDSNPLDLYLPLGERTCIKLKLISTLPEWSYFICQYGDNSFNLSQQLNENAFRYNAKYDRVKCILKGGSCKQNYMENQLLIANIGFNNCITMHFYDTGRDYTVFLSASVIINGLLPENYNILAVKIIDVSKSNGKKSSNYKIKMYGPLNQSIFNEKAQSQIYVQNNSQLLIQYFEENDTDGLQPYCSFKIPLNSLNWSNQLLQCQHQLKYYDTFKNIETNIALKLNIRKNFELSKIIPKLSNTEVIFDQESPLLLQQIKIQNCFLYQVLKNNEVQLFHVNFQGKITAFNKFTIIQNKTEYAIQTRQVITNGGKGTLYLINLDQQFNEKPTQNIEDSLILKITIQQPNKIQESKVIFANKFLAFAKKASVVNICKKLNKMVHDDLLKLKIKSRYTGNIRKGILKIINAKCYGPFGKVEASITIDQVSKHIVGQVGNYLMEKYFNFYVHQGSVRIKLNIQAMENHLQSANQEKNKQNIQICYYGNFCDFFGTPTNSKIHSQQIKLTPTHKLQMIYSFQQGQKLMPSVNKPNQLNQFSPNNNISLKLKRAFVSVNNKCYKFRVSRGTYAYESHQYKCSNNKIYFSESQKMILAVSNGEEINPIFISCYSYDEQDKLLIYNGFINIKDICGKGQYQIVLVYQKQQKRKELFCIFQVTHSILLMDELSMTIKLSKIGANTGFQILKTIYKYYLLIQINHNLYQICQCNINQNLLILNTSISLQKTDSLTFSLYSSYKAISKQLFQNTQKQLMGYGQIICQQIQQNGNFVLNYYPKKQSQLKYTKNHLIIQQKSYKLYLSYQTQKQKTEGRVQHLKTKPNLTEIDVLNKGVFYPLKIDNKIITIQIKPINLLFSSQSHYKINKQFLIQANNMQFQLQACITTKQGQKYKRTASKAYTKLRGKHYRTNQQTSLIIYFQKYFYITADFVILHNKFVAVPEGIYVVKEIATRGVKVDRFDVTFIGQIRNQEADDQLIKKEGTQAKGCNIQLKTFSQLNTLLFNFQCKKVKVKQKICLSQINIQKYQEDFCYERQILVSGESLILTLIVSYNCIKQNQKEQMSIKYHLQNLKEISISYPRQHYNMLTLVKQKQKLPNKNTGFHLKFTIPLDLATNTKELHFYSGKQIVKLNPSVYKNQEYIYYSNTILEVKTVKLINKVFIDKPIEALGKQKNIQKFMIDQNPKLIITLQQTPCSISDIGNENWTFKFNFHRLLTLNNKRLLSLKNTPNDQILTKQLALAVKHGKQCHFIRNLDEFGSIKKIQPTELQFGYDNTCNIVQIFLIIDNYFNRQIDNFQKLSLNWMQLFPISYGTINISQILPNQPFGFQLKPLDNYSYNLQKAINKIVIRQQDINCICSISFSKKCWGFITIKLVSCTPVNLVGKDKEEIYLYFKLQIEDNNRVLITSFNTEARPANKLQNIEFTSNRIDFLFIQDNIENHYNLKMTGFILENGNHYAFMQKKQEISDYLQRRGKQDINVQVKSNDTNNLCKNTIQICLQLQNAMTPPQRENLIEKAKSINKVDALSFRQIGSNQFFQRLLGCQQLSHFNECLQEIKQSFIYQQDSQYDSFVFLIQYLSYNFDAKLIGQICEIIHLNLLKCPQIISQLESSGENKRLYDYFKLICQRQRKKVPSKVIKVTGEQYTNQITKFKQNKDLGSLSQVLQKQQYLLYTSQQLLGSLSSKNNQIVLNIINLLLKNSEQIRNSLHQNIDQWIQMFRHTPQNSQFQLFFLVLKNLILYGQKLNQQKLQQLVSILMQRAYSLSTVFQFWQKIEQRNNKITLYQQILLKYQKELDKSSVQVCRGLKMMISQLCQQKDAQFIQYFTKIHLGIDKRMLENISQSSDIIVLSSNLDFLSFLYEKKMIDESIKNQISNIIKERLASSKDNSIKLILTNYASKFKTKVVKIVNTNKKEGLANEMANKAGFYKKYLITSD